MNEDEIEDGRSRWESKVEREDGKNQKIKRV